MLVAPNSKPRSDDWTRSCRRRTRTPRPEGKSSEYPATPPYTREHLRQVFHDFQEPELRRILGENAAALYGFDMAKLAQLAETYGPTVEEIARPLQRLPQQPNSALLRAAG